MKEIKLNHLLLDIILKVTYSKIYAKDGDGNFHMVNNIDIMDEKINCEDGWYQYFDAFDGENNFLYV